jgi:1-deoxy-D-xylulose-5-phosphate synthase
MVIAAPKDETELRDLLYTGVMHTDGPFALRFPRGNGTGAATDAPMKQIPIGQGEQLREGGDVTLVGFGATVAECLKAADILEEAGIQAAVMNARFAKPLDEEMLIRLARETGGLVTAEENVRAGGFGEAVLDVLSDHRLADKFLDAITMPDSIVDHGPQKTMRQIHQLDAAGIAARAKAALDARQSVTSLRASGVA